MKGQHLQWFFKTNYFLNEKTGQQRLSYPGSIKAKMEASAGFTWFLIMMAVTWGTLISFRILMQLLWDEILLRRFVISMLTGPIKSLYLSQELIFKYTETKVFSKQMVQSHYRRKR